MWEGKPRILFDIEPNHEQKKTEAKHDLLCTRKSLEVGGRVVWCGSVVWSGGVVGGVGVGAVRRIYTRQQTPRNDKNEKKKKKKGKGTKGANQDPFYTLAKK